MIYPFHVEDGSGTVLATAHRSEEGWIGLVEMIVSDSNGRFLLALRLRNLPGRPIFQAPSPYLVVDDQGRTIGELSSGIAGLGKASYALWRQGEEYLSIPSTSSSQPYPVVQRGAPVATVTETKPLMAKPGLTRYTIDFSAPCQHLHVLGLMARVAAHHAGTM